MTPTDPDGTELPASSRRLRSGDRLGDYVVGDLLARGGYGWVHRARHRVTGERVAIKVMRGSLATMPKMVERFTREVELVKLLRHPNIVDVREVGTLPAGAPYYVMEYIEGRTLAALIDEQGRLSPAEALSILEPVCSALAAAHAAGIVHRDVKSGNIMIGEGAPRIVKLLDFGIAKLIDPEAPATGLTTIGRPIGTLAIMAPEQIRSEPLDHRVDIYALGVVLYRMLTGRVPFLARTAHELVHQHLEEPPSRPSERVPLTPAIDAVVLRCLEKQRERRFGSALEVVEALREAMARPAADRKSGAPILGYGAAVYVELRVGVGEEEWDDALSDSVGQILDCAEDALRSAGVVVVASTGTEILGVRALSASAESAVAERAAVLAVAADLRHRLDHSSFVDRRVHVNVAVHTDQVMLRAIGSPEVLGGALLRTDLWTPRENVADLCATPAAVAGVEGFTIGAGPGALVTVRRAPAREGALTP